MLFILLDPIYDCCGSILIDFGLIHLQNRSSAISSDAQSRREKKCVNSLGVESYNYFRKLNRHS